jgi:hypothetical protein
LPSYCAIAATDSPQVLKASFTYRKDVDRSASETDFRKRLMNGPTSTEPVEKTVPLAAERSEGRPSAEKGSSTSQPSKLHVRADADAERMSSMLIRMISNSVGEMESLIAELQEAQAFLKSEGERIQREITNYAQLNQSALAAIRVITDTVGPWKSAVLEHDSRNSDANSVLHGSDVAYHPAS